jgi:hypothetical protein
MRKNTREKTSRVVHLIKEPPKELHLHSRDLKDEIEQQKEIYQRIIRKVKKDNANIHTL